jgi:membrane protein DedA with SNARE-associated domain
MDFAKLLSLFLIYKYPIIFVVTVAEGPIVMVMSGLLVRLGYAGFWPIYIVLMVADLAGDTLWYGAGYYFAHQLVLRFGRFFSITPELLDKVNGVFHKHPKKILFISKITMGFGLPQVVLLVAGMTKLPFKKYIGSLFLGQIFFTGMLIAVGYFFGNIYETIGKDFKIFSLIVFFVLMILASSGIRSYFRKKNLEQII